MQKKEVTHVLRAAKLKFNIALYEDNVSCNVDTSSLLKVAQTMPCHLPATIPPL